MEGFSPEIRKNVMEADDKKTPVDAERGILDSKSMLAALLKIN